MKDSILGLLKFGKQPHIKSLQEGTIYMNPVNYFEKIEGNKIIGDKEEGLSLHLQPDDITVKIDDHIIDNEDIVSPISVRRYKDQNANIFCMYAISLKEVVENNFEFKLDRRVKQFGDKCLVIMNGEEFVNRIKKAVKKINSKATWYEKEMGLVEYVERDNFHGQVGVFKKFNEYEYQNEFRIALRVSKELRGEKGEFKLEIGDISDISIICDTDEIEAEIDIKHDEN